MLHKQDENASNKELKNVRVLLMRDNPLTRGQVWIEVKKLLDTSLPNFKVIVVFEIYVSIFTICNEYSVDKLLFIKILTSLSFQLRDCLLYL